MTNKKLFRFYTLLWVCFIASLFHYLYGMYGDEHIVNYTGMIRGSTQKVVASEMYGSADDELIAYVDEIIGSLETGSVTNGDNIENDEIFQEKLLEIKEVWEAIKEEVMNVRAGEDKDVLYTLSLEHYELSDNLAYYVETESAGDLTGFFCLFMLSFFVSFALLSLIYDRNRREVERTVDYDVLTGKLSRVGFEKEARKLLSFSGEQHLIVKIDIDQFKMINRRYGHYFSDQLLCKVASALASIDEENAICTRIVADNFMVLTKGDYDIVKTMNEVIVDHLGSLNFKVGVEEVQFVYSAYLIQDNKESIETVMDKVNLAHRYAKEKKQKDVVWYDARLIEMLETEEMYVERIEEAVKNKEFKVYLQPKIDLHTMEVTGAESLVRWFIDDQLIYPDCFIPLFEQRGLIPMLDFYMLEEVCYYLSSHSEMKIAVNFSRATIAQKNFANRVEEVTKKYPIQPSSIEIEITETTFNEIDNQVINQLTLLKEKGYTIAMDDFGAGYSSLNILSRLPITTLKLDCQFLWGMDDNQKMASIIESIIDMAHKIDVLVVCEGVEKESHLQFVKDVSCDFAQGYFIDRPVTIELFDERYKSRN